MLTLIVVILYICIVLLDFIPMKNTRSKKENVLYCMLLTVSFCVLLLYSFGVTVPSPTQFIRNAVEIFVPIK